MKFLLPFKGLEKAKSRWPELKGKRGDLAFRLLADNFQTVSQVVGTKEVLIVTPDPKVLKLFPQESGLLTSGGGLNQDLRMAREKLFAPETTEGLIVLLPDLPTLSRDDVEELHCAGSNNPIVLCPDTLGVGTNAVSIRPSYALDFLFEGSSFQRYLSACQERALEVKVLERPGLASDCDDLEALRRFSLL